jgi:hypothetical protein
VRLRIELWEVMRGILGNNESQYVRVYMGYGRVGGNCSAIAVSMCIL